MIMVIGLLACSEGADSPGALSGLPPDAIVDELSDEDLEDLCDAISDTLVSDEVLIRAMCISDAVGTVGMGLCEPYVEACMEVFEDPDNRACVIEGPLDCDVTVEEFESCALEDRADEVAALEELACDNVFQFGNAVSAADRSEQCRDVTARCASDGFDIIHRMPDPDDVFPPEGQMASSDEEEPPPSMEEMQQTQEMMCLEHVEALVDQTCAECICERDAAAGRACDETCFSLLECVELECAGDSSNVECVTGACAGLLGAATNTTAVVSAGCQASCSP